jgi:hypothetical protein
VLSPITWQEVASHAAKATDFPGDFSWTAGIPILLLQYIYAITYVSSNLTAFGWGLTPFRVIKLPLLVADYFCVADRPTTLSASPYSSHIHPFSDDVVTSGLPSPSRHQRYSVFGKIADNVSVFPSNERFFSFNQSMTR